MRYWYPRFDGIDLLGLRFGGPGLGNLLLTWARCHVKASALGEPVIRPTWPQFKIGPRLRREADVRWYGDLFSPSPFELGGLRRAWLLLRANRVNEQAVLRDTPLGPDTVVEVRGIQGLFEELVDHRALILNRLMSSVRPDLAARNGCHYADSVAVHVRLGDFATPSLDAQAAGPANTRVPLRWYREAVLRLRAELGTCLPVVVFSDGREDELRDLLALPAVRRSQETDALGDLLAMASCAGLVASGSTYSMWSSFLGQQPTLWHPGQRRRSLTADPAAEVEHLGGSLAPAFVASLQRRLAAPVLFNEVSPSPALSAPAHD